MTQNKKCKRIRKWAKNLLFITERQSQAIKKISIWYEMLKDILLVEYTMKALKEITSKQYVLLEARLHMLNVYIL